MGTKTRLGSRDPQPSEPSERPKPASMLGSAADGSKSNRPATVRQPSERTRRPAPFEDLPEELADLPFEPTTPAPLAAPPPPRASQRKPRKAKLTDDLVEGLEPEPRQYYVWDLKNKGLGVRIGATGTRAFVFKVPLPGGRSKWLTLEAETVAEAVEEYLQCRIDYGRGKEITKKRQKALWQDVVDAFSDEHLKTLEASSASTYRSALKHVRAAFRDRPIHAITYGNLSAFHESMSATPRQANVCLRLMGAIFDFAVSVELWNPTEQGLTPYERLKKVKKRKNGKRGMFYTETKRNRRLSDDELARLGGALAELEATSRMQVAAVRLLLFTGKRLREILDLRWDQIDLIARTIFWEKTKTGEMTAPLNDLALGVLQSIPRMKLTGTDGKVVECPYVLPTAKGKPIRDLSKFWARLLKLAKIEGIHRHDMRHAHGNMASDLGLNLQRVAVLLGHKDAHTSERYSKGDAATEISLADSQAVASGLARKLGGK